VLSVVDDFAEGIDAARHEEVEVERHEALRGFEDALLLTLRPRANRVDAALVPEPVEDVSDALQIDGWLEESRHIHRAFLRNTILGGPRRRLVRFDVMSHRFASHIARGLRAAPLFLAISATAALAGCDAPGFTSKAKSAANVAKPAPPVTGQATT